MMKAMHQVISILMMERVFSQLSKCITTVIRDMMVIGVFTDICLSPLLLLASAVKVSWPVPLLTR